MPNIWRPQSIEIYQYWVQSIKDEASEKLTSWEEQFVESLHEQLHKGRNLSEKQATILERIYAEKTL